MSDNSFTLQSEDSPFALQAEDTTPQGDTSPFALQPEDTGFIGKAKQAYEYYHTPTEPAKDVVDWFTRVVPESAAKTIVGTAEMPYQIIKSYTDPFIKSAAKLPQEDMSTVGTELIKDLGKSTVKNIEGFAEFQGEPIGLYGWDRLKQRWATDPVGSTLSVLPLAGGLFKYAKSKGMTPHEAISDIHAQDRPVSDIIPLTDVVEEPEPIPLTDVVEEPEPIPLTDVVKEEVPISPSPQGFESPESDNMIDRLLSDESGTVGITAGVNKIKDYLDKTSKEMDYSGDIADDFYRLKTNNAADQIETRRILESTDLSPADAEQIYHHIENPVEPLTPKQSQQLRDTIEPIREARAKEYAKAINNGVPLDNQEHLTPRFVSERGGFFDRLTSGAKSIMSGSLLRKTSSHMKHRNMKAIVDEKGNRAIVSIKDNKVNRADKGIWSEFGNLNLKSNEELLDKKIKPIEAKVDKLKNEFKILDSIKVVSPISEAKLRNLNEKAAVLASDISSTANTYVADYGKKAIIDKAQEQQLRGLIHDIRLLSEVKPAEDIVLRKRRMDTLSRKIGEFEKTIKDIQKDYHPESLDNKFFVDKNGKKWRIQEATTKEIEGNTDVKYHKNVLLNELTTYNELRKINRAIDYLNSLKNNPEFSKISIKIGTQNIPEGYKTTSLPQLMGYAFPERIAEVFDDMYGKTISGKEDAMGLYASVNRVLRNAIFFNPLIHVPNIANHAIVNRGIKAWVNPYEYVPFVKAGTRAIKATLTMNNDYVQALRNGAPLLYSGVENKNLYKLMLDKMGTELQQKSSIGKQISSALGYANPANLVKGIYNMSSKVTWAVNDIATLEAIYEEMGKGRNMDKAIHDVGKHIPNYRIPSRILNFRTLSKVMSNPNITMFGAYHYGALKSYGEMIKSVVKPMEEGERIQALDKLAMLGIITYVIYPQLDKLAKEMTGSDKSKVRRAGASTFIYNTQQTIKGQDDFATYLQSVITPSVGLNVVLEGFYQRNPHTGKSLFTPETEGRDLLKFGASTLAPVGAAEKIRAGDISFKNFMLNLIGISTPKNTPSERNLQRMIYEDRNTVSKEAQRLVSEDRRDKALAMINKYNDRLILNAKDAAKENNREISDAKIRWRLKRYLLHMPSYKALNNLERNKDLIYTDKLLGTHSNADSKEAKRLLEDNGFGEEDYRKLREQYSDKEIINGLQK